MHYLRIFRRKLLFALVVSMIGCSGTGEEIPITTHSEEARALFLEGRELHENLRNEEARIKFDEAIEQDAGFAIAYYYRAMTPVSYADRQKYVRRAIQYASKASDGERLMIKALEATIVNEYGKAADIIGKLIELYPDDGRGYWQKAFYLTNSGMTDEAIHYFKEAIKIDKTFPPSYNNLGYLLFNQGRYKESEKAFKSYIRLIPDEPNPHDSIGDLYLRMGNFELAITHYEKALELNADFISSKRNIGISKVFLGEFEEARAIFLDSDNNLRLLNLNEEDLLLVAMTYNYEGKPREALKIIGLYLDKATEKNDIPALAQGYLYQVLIHLLNNEVERARNNLAKLEVVAKSETLATAARKEYKYQIGAISNILLVQEGNVEQGLQNMIRFKDEMIAADNVDEAQFSTALGFIYYEAGNFTKAIAALSKGYGNDPIKLYLQAIAEERLGNDNEAKVLYTYLANLNRNGLTYSLVRHRALEALQR